MSERAYETIRDEHQALATVLRTMTMMLAQSRRLGEPLDFGTLRAMLFYIDEFPERLHHTKESLLLFPKIRKRCPELATLLDHLDEEHHLGEARIRKLQHLMVAFELIGETRREEFEQELGRYVDGYMKHMAVEEHQVLPAARQHLTPSDWEELDAAFGANQDPLVGHASAAVYQPLFHTILSALKAPLGIG